MRKNRPDLDKQHEDKLKSLKERLPKLNKKAEEYAKEILENPMKYKPLIEPQVYTLASEYLVRPFIEDFKDYTPREVIHLYDPMKDYLNEKAEDLVKKIEAKKNSDTPEIIINELYGQLYETHYHAFMIHAFFEDDIFQKKKYEMNAEISMKRAKEISPSFEDTA